MNQVGEKLISFLEKNEISSFSFSKNENDTYSFGDILLAKRYENGKEKKKIPVGHREGPYFVLQGNGDRPICFYGTRKCPSYEDFPYYFVVEPKTSGLSERIYFSYRDIRVLRDFSILSKMGSLPEEAKEEVKANIENVMRKEQLRKAVREEIDQFPLIPGDIFVEEGKCYLFLKEENDSVFLLPLEEKGDFQVSVSNQIAFVSSASVFSSKKKKAYHRIGYISNQLVDAICDRVFVDTVVKSSHSFTGSVNKQPHVLHEQRKSNQTDALVDAVSDVDFDMENFGYLGAVVSFKVDKREYIVLLKEGDFVVLLDKEKYMEGEFYLQTASFREIKKLRYLTRNSFLEVLHSLQDKYSSYLDSGYIRSLSKLYEIS